MFEMTIFAFSGPAWRSDPYWTEGCPRPSVKLEQGSVAEKARADSVNSDYVTCSTARDREDQGPDPGSHQEATRQHWPSGEL